MSLAEQHPHLNSPTQAPLPEDFEANILYFKNPGRPCAEEVVTDESLHSWKKVLVKDIRPDMDSYKLDVHGFQVFHLPYKQRKDADINEVRKAYYAEIEQLLKDQLGVRHIYCFAPVLRPVDYQEKPYPSIGKTNPVPHLDFGPSTAPHWWETITEPGIETNVPAWLESIGVDASDLSKNIGPRFCLLGIWRPLYHHVEKDPLCMVDFRTVPPEDYLHMQPKKRRNFSGEWSILMHGDEEKGVHHQWYYLSKQRLDEVLVFKHFDSAQDGRAWRCGHGAYPIPGTEHLPDRHSIEVRVFGIY